MGKTVYHGRHATAYHKNRSCKRLYDDVRARPERHARLKGLTKCAFCYGGRTLSKAEIERRQRALRQEPSVVAAAKRVGISDAALREFRKRHGDGQEVVVHG